MGCGSSKTVVEAPPAPPEEKYVPKPRAKPVRPSAIQKFHDVKLQKAEENARTKYDASLRLVERRGRRSKRSAVLTKIRQQEITFMEETESESDHSSEDDGHALSIAKHAEELRGLMSSSRYYRRHWTQLRLQNVFQRVPEGPLIPWTFLVKAIESDIGRKLGRSETIIFQCHLDVQEPASEVTSGVPPSTVYKVVLLDFFRNHADLLKRITSFGERNTTKKNRGGELPPKTESFDWEEFLRRHRNTPKQPCFKCTYQQFVCPIHAPLPSKSLLDRQKYQDAVISALLAKENDHSNAVLPNGLPLSGNPELDEAIRSLRNSEIPIWNGDVGKNEGRSDEDGFGEYFSRNRVIVITGQEGIGKSFFATQAIWNSEVRDKFGGRSAIEPQGLIVWVFAEDSWTTLSLLHHLACVISRNSGVHVPESVMDEFGRPRSINYLFHTKEQGFKYVKDLMNGNLFLLVLDGLGSSKLLQELSTGLPDSFTFLVTTRLKNLDKLKDVEPRTAIINIPPLSNSEGVHLLGSALGLSANQLPWRASVTMVKECDHSTLGIAVASHALKDLVALELYPQIKGPKKIDVYGAVSPEDVHLQQKSFEEKTRNLWADDPETLIPTLELCSRQIQKERRGFHFLGALGESGNPEVGEPSFRFAFRSLRSDLRELFEVVCLVFRAFSKGLGSCIVPHRALEAVLVSFVCSKANRLYDAEHEAERQVERASRRASRRSGTTAGSKRRRSKRKKNGDSSGSEVSSDISSSSGDGEEVVEEEHQADIDDLQIERSRIRSTRDQVKRILDMFSRRKLMAKIIRSEGKVHFWFNGYTRLGSSYCVCYYQHSALQKALEKNIIQAFPVLQAASPTKPPKRVLGLGIPARLRKNTASKGSDWDEDDEESDSGSGGSRRMPHDEDDLDDSSNDDGERDDAKQEAEEEEDELPDKFVVQIT